jgi:hypothetical protein
MESASGPRKLRAPIVASRCATNASCRIAPPDVLYLHRPAARISIKILRPALVCDARIAQQKVERRELVAYLAPRSRRGL